MTLQITKVNADWSRISCLSIYFALENNAVMVRFRLETEINKPLEEVTRLFSNRDLLVHFEGTYEMKGVFNRNINTFQSSGPHKTRWTCESEFRFTGLMKLIAFFMRSGFREQSRVIMANFKKFVENK